MKQVFAAALTGLLLATIILAEDSFEDLLTARHRHRHCHGGHRYRQGVCPSGQRCVPTYRCSNSSLSGVGLIDIRQSYSNPCVDYWLQCCNEEDIISCGHRPRPPTQRPTQKPTEWPTQRPTVRPTERPTERPTQRPTDRPTERPTEQPTQRPTDRPTERPTKQPTGQPLTERPTKTPTEKPTPTVPVTPPDDFNGCGERKPNGIGYRLLYTTHNESEYGEFPWMMAILKRDPASGEQYQCGGSLIHPRVVLTAAHCIDGHQPGQLSVRGGEWDTNTDNEPFDTQNRSVIEMVTHPAYYKPGLHNDVALLFLNESMNLDEVVQTVCLPPTGTNFDHQNCFVAGWGKKSFNDAEAYQVILKKLELPVVPSAQCEETLRTTALRATFELHEGFLCAGGQPGKDACTGDGGSALVCAIKGSEFYHQAGIVSWGLRCGDPIPGVYVDVSRYREWIDQEMQKHQLDTSTYVPVL